MKLCAVIIPMKPLQLFFTFFSLLPYVNKLQFAYTLCNFPIGLLAVAFAENLLASVVFVLLIVKQPSRLQKKPKKLVQK